MIRIEGLTKRHGAHVVLDGLDLHVQRGAMEAVIGPSGTGKSTLLRCLNGLVPFDDGRIAIAGRTLDRETLQSLRKQVGFVFQQLHLFPHLTVSQNLIEAPTQVDGESRGSAMERALALLERFGLSHREAAMPGALSGGEQQRVAIARALMMRPSALLLDEPTSALDPVRSEALSQLLRSLTEDGLTVLMVTHDLSFARAAADRIHVLDNGRIVESQLVEQLFERPEHATTRALLGTRR